jgi:SWIM/SEC-C metal-binding protein
LPSDFCPGSAPAIKRLQRTVVHASTLARSPPLISSPISPTNCSDERRSMAKLGESGRPAVVRVQTLERAEEILSICNLHGWKVIVGLEPDHPEDIFDVERLLNPQEPTKAISTVGRNDPCPCGSGFKYKKCCGK